jgi:hypothetical protein
MTKEEFLFASGLDFNHLYTLQNLNNLPNLGRRVEGWLNILIAKGFIDDDHWPTEKGNEILSKFNNSQTVVNIEQDGSLVEEPVKNESVKTFSNFVDELDTKLKEKIKKLTGHNQAYITVQNVKYPYLSDAVDLESKLKKFVTKYKKQDLKRIEACLLKHCEIRNQKILMYIMREKGDSKSDLAVDYDNYVEELPKITNIKKEDFF